jgi:hypothetical protein
MTEDPVKLYVLVMAILLCVLSYVAWSSYRDAEAYEAAIARAPQEAKRLKQLASEVKGLVDQLGESKMREGERSLIDGVLKRKGIPYSAFDTDTPPIGRGIKGREKRFKVSFGSGKASPPLSREQIVLFCQAVEAESRGILKTIDLKLSRKSGDGAPEPGQDGAVTGDRYSGEVVFGLRVVEQ